MESISETESFARTATGKDEMTTPITSVTVTATYERAARKVTIAVDASGEIMHDGIELEEIRPSPSLYRDGDVLCVDLVFKDRHGAIDQRWSAEKSFPRSADYVVLLHAGQVLTARLVEKV